MPRAAPLSLAFLALAGGTVVIAQRRGESNHSEQSVRTYLQNRLRSAREYPDSRYALVWVDLNGDGREEAVVRIMSRGYCGTGGCLMYVLSPRGPRWSLVGRITVTQPPVRVLDSRTRGWHDLGVHQSFCCESGRQVSYEARLPFDGRLYPFNPSMPPARRLRRPAPGRILISAADRGRSLF